MNNQKYNRHPKRLSFSLPSLKAVVAVKVDLRTELDCMRVFHLLVQELFDF